MKLPLFVTQNNKYLSGAIMYAISYVCYYVTNHHPIFTPHELPFTWIDAHVPFVPESVLVYISEYFYFAFVYILLRDDDNINKYLYSFLSLQLVSCAIFVVCPTIYPRELFPIPAGIPDWLTAVWTWLRTQDAATNCLPSLHVSSVYLSAFAFITDRKMKHFWVFFVWGSLIALSTLTTKQHYLLDIITGLLFALMFFNWFHLKQGYVRVFGRRLSGLATEPTPE